MPTLAMAGAAEQLAFSPDSRHLASACADSTTDSRTASIVDVTDGGRIVRSLPHPNGVSSVAYSPDGRKIVTSCRDGRARVWEATGRLIAQTAPHQMGVGTAVFNRDASLIATASMDGKARVWEAVTGAPISPWLKHEGHLWHAGFNPEGDRLLTASGTRSGLGRALIWELAPTDGSAAELQLMAKALSGCEVDDALNLVPLDANALQGVWRQWKSDYPENFSAPSGSTGQ